jgi:hypothetical protein
LRAKPSAASVGLIAVLMTTPAHARTMPAMYVAGEKDTPQMIACMVSYSEAMDTVRAALRFNRVEIATRQDWLADKALRAYVNISALSQQYVSGQSIGSCSVRVDLEIGTATTIINPVTGESQFSQVLFCNRGGILQWERSTLAVKIKNSLETYVNACVTEYTTVR